ncbi:MAG: imidazole glycerol phosphate synthase subunit HisH [Proteobacteria bacterium]|nr:imidazole glycerol phosphate synthase subunit HisH [Pseudomonadota bacterium]MBU1739975.1 imidazole glycerol phosphate synthase subunit HisH [Pseudomonadota bacterium]
MAIVDYRAGNLTSVARALAHLGFDGRVTADPDEVRAAERVIFPGVGAAGAAMADLRASGMGAAIQDFCNSGRPLLGICLGTQIVMDFSDEDGGVECLGLVPGTVKRFPEHHDGRRLKVPHMGWNRLQARGGHPVMKAWGDPKFEYYFVHSYFPVPADETDVVATTEYQGVWFPSVIARKNLVATQFHLEKSGRPGLEMLSAFCRWDGRHAV